MDKYNFNLWQWVKKEISEEHCTLIDFLGCNSQNHAKSHAVIFSNVTLDNTLSIHILIRETYQESGNLVIFFLSLTVFTRSFTAMLGVRCTVRTTRVIKRISAPQRHCQFLPDYMAQHSGRESPSYLLSRELDHLPGNVIVILHFFCPGCHDCAKGLFCHLHVASLWVQHQP
jgi:hypothetical protein